MSKIQNQICQQTLDFDETIKIAEATSECIMKEKFVAQGTIHKIARGEASIQCKRDFARLKNSIAKKLAKKLNTPKNNNQNNNQTLE